jgi:hypothetical protein
MKVNVIGFPYNTDLESECLDLIRLWRDSGVGIRIIPTSPVPASIITRLTDLGCEFLFHLIDNVPGKILEANDIRQGLVIGLYDTAFFDAAIYLRAMGCRLIWMGEPVVTGAERSFYKEWGLCDRYVVKSYFHRALLLAELIDFRCDADRVLRIKPPFFADLCEFNIVPHIPNSTMCVGKVGCAADHDFYPANSWKILSGSSTPVRAVVSEWSDHLESILQRPKWVEVLPVYRPSEFYSKIHCLIQVANRKESWLRFALDSMAYGTPVIAQNDSGWKELIRHGDNGFLCNSPDEVHASLDMLAQDENLRIEIAIRARESLFGELIDNHASSIKWCKIFEELS